MAQSPLISVVIPAYNAADFIDATLASVVAQSCESLEIIVVDDGSTDGTAAKVRVWLERDSRIALIQQDNQGVAAARNRGVAAAKGDFVAPLDADDIWYPDKLKEQLACLRKAGQEVGFVYTWWQDIDTEGKLLASPPRWHLEGDVYAPLVFLNFMGNASTPLLKRSAFERVGGYRTQINGESLDGCEDWDLMLRLAEQYEAEVVPHFLVGYRQVPHGRSRDYSAMERAQALIHKDIRERHPDLPPKVLRWSRSQFYLYLLHLSHFDGAHQEALRYGLKALKKDWGVVLAPGVLLLFLTSLFAAGLERLGVRRHPTPDERSPNFISVLNRGLGRNLKDARNPWRSWLPYDRLCLRRWREVQRLTLTRNPP